jgi:hypothetical protein
LLLARVLAALAACFAPSVGCSDGAVHADAEPDDGSPEGTAEDAGGDDGGSSDEGTVVDVRRDIDRDWSPVDGFAEHDARDGVGYDAVDGGGDGAECTALLGGVCNPVEQCGCGPDERCVLQQLGTDRFTEICVADGSDPFGTPCAGVDNCVRGNQCFSFRSAYRVDYECVRFCYDDRQCEERAECTFSPWCGVCVDLDVPYHFCSDSVEPCDVFTADGCALDERCVVTLGGTFCDGTVWDCGAECPTVGWYCEMELDGEHTCHKYCRLDGTPPDCADLPGTRCGGIGHPEIGTCMAVE